MHHPEEEEEYDYESLGSNTTMLQNAFAGALAGIAEHCAMYPVDSIKVKISIDRIKSRGFCRLISFI
jgi:solute carrier family 25 iron transporter 28/37